jgi:hypothetical protein
MSGSTGHRDKRITDYVRNRADDEAARQLEIDMLESDELFEAVQTEELLREGLGSSDTADDTAAANETGSGWFAPMGWALAATFAAATVLLGFYAAMLSDQVGTLQSPSAGLPVVTLFQQRSALLGDDSTPETLQTGAKGALIEIDVSAASASRFRLVLQTETRQYRWESIERDERGYVTIFLPPNAQARSIRVETSEGTLIRNHEFNP